MHACTCVTDQSSCDPVCAVMLIAGAARDIHAERGVIGRLACCAAGSAAEGNHDCQALGRHADMQVNAGWYDSSALQQ